MKNIILLLLLTFPVLLFAQYPTTGNKQRLGWQTTGEGLVYRGSGAPAYTPTTRNNAYVYQDTVANRYYQYSNGVWRDLSDEKYIKLQNASILAGAVKDSITIYDRLFVAMELTTGAASDRGVQLPVTGLDSTYAGRVVRLSSLDSSGTYNIFVSSSSPDGLLVDNTATTTYYLADGETAEFQLYVYGALYQWRLVHTNNIETFPIAPSEGNILRSDVAGAPEWYQIAQAAVGDTIATWNPTTLKFEYRTKSSLLSGLISLTSLSATTPLQYNNTTGVFSILQANTSQSGYLSSTDWNTFNNKPGGTGMANQWAYWSGTNTLTTSNYLTRSTDRLSLGTLLKFNSYTTVGIPAAFGAGDLLYNSTLNAYTGHNGTRTGYFPYSTFGTGTPGSVLFLDANGQIAQDNSNLFWDNTGKYLQLTNNTTSGSVTQIGLHVRNQATRLSSGGGSKYGILIEDSGTWNFNIGTERIGLYIKAYSGSIYGNYNASAKFEQPLLLGNVSVTAVTTGALLTMSGYSPNSNNINENTILILSGGSTAGWVSGITYGINSANLSSAVHFVNTGGGNRESDIVFKASNDGALTERWRIKSDRGRLTSNTTTTSNNIILAGEVLNIAAKTSTNNLGTSGNYSSLMPSTVFVGRTTMASTVASVTIPSAATLYLQNAPLASTNITITNPYTLFVDDGATRLDGSLEVQTRTGTATSITGFDASNKLVDLVLGTGLSITSGTLNVATYTGWTLAGDTGTPQSIGSGNTATVLGGYGVNTTASATRNLTVEVDTAQLATKAYVGGELSGLITVDSVFHIASLADTATLVAQMGNHIVVADECNAIYIKAADKWRLVEAASPPKIEVTYGAKTYSNYVLEMYIEEGLIGGITQGDTIEFAALKYNGVNVLSTAHTFEINEDGDCIGYEDFYNDAIAGLNTALTSGVAYGYVDYDCEEDYEYIDIDIQALGLSATDTIELVIIKNGDTTSILEGLDDTNGWIYEYISPTPLQLTLNFDSSEYDTITYSTVAGLAQSLKTNTFKANLLFGSPKTGNITFTKCGVAYTYCYTLNSDYSYTFGLCSENIWYVSEKTGNDATAEKGNPDKPLLSLTTALSSAVASQDIIHIFPGTYTTTDTLVEGQRIVAELGSTVTLKARAGEINSKGNLNLTYIPANVSDVLDVVGNYVSCLNAQLNAGGTLNINAKWARFGTSTNNSTAVKTINIIAERFSQISEIGNYGTTLGNFNYNVTCNRYESASFVFGSGNGVTMANNRVFVKANYLTVDNKLLFIDVRTSSSFPNNKINIEANYVTANQPMADYMRVYPADGNTSDITLNFGEYRYTGASYSLMNSFSHWDGFTSRFTLSGHYISDTKPIFEQNTGTLATGFTFENALLEVKQAGVSIISIPTLNTGTSYPIRFINSSLRNDGSTAKIVVTTPTTKVLGDYRDLNGNYTVRLADYTNQTSTSSPMTLIPGDNLINQGGTQATFTFNLPSSPTDGAICRLVFINAVTICSVGGGTILGASVTTATAGDVLEYKYYTSGTTWVRIQ